MLGVKLNGIEWLIKWNGNTNVYLQHKRPLLLTEKAVITVI